MPNAYDLEAIQRLLASWADCDWLTKALEKVVAGEVRSLNMQFSMVPHRIADEALVIADDERAAVADARTGWQPETWTRRDAARTLILMATATDPAVVYERAEQLFVTADVGEHVSLYRALAVLPEGERYLARAREGTRTNITDVFNVIAHHNPYPADYFPDEAWNQLVLKNHFMGQPTATMIGIDERCNPDLAVMLTDYARERRAASRSVPKDLWRCVGKCATPDMRPDLELTAASSDPVEAAAGRLALADAGFADAPDESWATLFPPTAGL